MTTNVPVVSVVVPVYNAENSIRRCIDSLLSQFMRDFEIIVVDDGSLDRTAAIVRDLAASDPRVRLIPLPHGGVSTARNVGMDAATGRWITFVDADDYVDNDFLSALLDGCEPSLDTEMALCGHTCHEDGKPAQQIEIFKRNGHKGKMMFSPSELLRYLNVYVLTGSWAKLFRTDIIRREKLVFPTDMSFGEDTSFVLNYLKHIRRIRLKRGFGYHVDRTINHESLAAIACPSNRLRAYRLFFRLASTILDATPGCDRSNVERHYIDGVLDALRQNWKMENPSLSVNERRFCYDSIYKSTSPRSYRSRLPWFFGLCGFRRQWNLFETVYKFIYL